MSGSFTRLRAVILCSVSLLVTGCVTIERSEYPDRRYFALHASGQHNSAQRTLKGILEVAELGISPRYQGQSFVYRTSEVAFETDYYNLFLVRPAALISEEVRNSLAEWRAFDTVISSSRQLQPTHRLEGMVHALYGDFSDSGAGKAVLQVQFVLTKTVPMGTAILIDKRYAQAVPLSRRSPEALVKAWDEALKAIMKAFLADLSMAPLG